MGREGQHEVSETADKCRHKHVHVWRQGSPEVEPCEHEDREEEEGEESGRMEHAVLKAGKPCSHLHAREIGIRRDGAGWGEAGKA